MFESICELSFAVIALNVRMYVTSATTPIMTMNVIKSLVKKLPAFRDIDEDFFRAAINQVFQKSKCLSRANLGVNLFCGIN